MYKVVKQILSAEFYMLMAMSERNPVGTLQRAVGCCDTAGEAGNIHS